MKIHNSKFKIFVVFLLFLITRLFPYFNNPVPTGYDAGLYLLNFKTFPHIPQWVEVGFAPGLYAFLYPFFKLGLSPESILIPLSIFSQIVLFLSIYFVGRKVFNQKVVLFILFIFTVSSIQFRTFWYFYLNNTFGLSFLLLSLYFFTKRKFIPALFFTLLVGFFHLPTFLILFLIIAFEVVFNSKQRLFYLGIILSIIIAGSFYYLPHLKQAIQPYFPYLLKAFLLIRILTGEDIPSGGAFYNLPTFFLLTILYLPLVIFGLYSMRDKFNTLRPFVVGLVITSVLVCTRFAFYKRFSIHLDIFLVFFAGLGLYHLYEKFQKKKQTIDLLQFYILILAVFILGFIYKTSSPLISKSVFEEIKSFSKTASSGYILSLTSEDPAWLMGYTNLPVIARQFGAEDKYWNSSQWATFFLHEDAKEKIKLLNLLPKPLYIFINDQIGYQLGDLTAEPCIERKSPHFYQVTCQNLMAPF